MPRPDANPLFCFILLALAILLANTGRAAKGESTAEIATPATPLLLHTTVEMPRTSWRLGETPWAHFVVTNTGEQPVTLRFPRLSRGGNREPSYHVA